MLICRILYSNSVVLLLRPLLNLEGFPSHLIEDIVWTHAQEGLSLLDEHYRAKFGCRLQPVLQMSSLLHLTDVIIRFFPGGIEGRRKDGPEAVKSAFEMLEQSSLGFPIARPLKEMLRHTAISFSIRTPASQYEPERPNSPTKIFDMDAFIDACTRPTYVQPVAEIRQKYSPSLSAEWLAHAGSFGFLEPGVGSRGSRVPSAEEVGAQSLMQIRNLLNSN